MRCNTSRVVAKEFGIEVLPIRNRDYFAVNSFGKEKDVSTEISGRKMSARDLLLVVRDIPLLHNMKPGRIVKTRETPRA
jgi:hypothetical protein